MTIYDAGPLAAGPLCGLLKHAAEKTNNAGHADDQREKKKERGKIAKGGFVRDGFW